MSRSTESFTDRSAQTISDSSYLYGRRPGDNISSQWTLGAIKSYVQAGLTDIPQSSVTNLVSDLAGKAAVSHGHHINEITNLDNRLNSKQDLVQSGTGQVVGIVVKDDVGNLLTWNAFDADGSNVSHLDLLSALGLGAVGTGTKFLRDDGVWATP